MTSSELCVICVFARDKPEKGEGGMRRGLKGWRVRGLEGLSNRQLAGGRRQEAVMISE